MLPHAPALCARILALATWLLCSMSAAQESAKPEPKPPTPSTFGVLHQAEGAAETFAFCTGCHSEHIVAQQGLTREDWDDLFTVMEDEHGMAAIPEPSKTKILDYLSAHYGPDRPHFPK